MKTVAERREANARAAIERYQSLSPVQAAQAAQAASDG
jgi:hypothetical protein